VADRGKSGAVLAPILFVALAVVLLVWVGFARALGQMSAVPNLSRAPRRSRG
jgi:hypothetical protein